MFRVHHSVLCRLFLPLFTGVRGIGFLRTSPFGDSRKFAYTEFYEVRNDKQRLSNNKDSPSGRCACAYKTGQRCAGIASCRKGERRKATTRRELARMWPPKEEEDC